MRLTIRALGLDLLDIELATDSPTPEPECDLARDLSGGSIGYDRIDAGPTERYMGFTNGRGYEEDE